MLLCIPAAAILVLSSLVPGQTACNVLKKAADDPDCQAFASPGQLIDVSETPTSTKEKMLKSWSQQYRPGLLTPPVRSRYQGSLWIYCHNSCCQEWKCRHS